MSEKPGVRLNFGDSQGNLLNVFGSGKTIDQSIILFPKVLDEIPAETLIELLENVCKTEFAADTIYICANHPLNKFNKSLWFMDRLVHKLTVETQKYKSIDDHPFFKAYSDIKVKVNNHYEMVFNMSDSQISSNPTASPKANTSLYDPPESDNDRVTGSFTDSDIELLSQEGTYRYTGKFFEAVKVYKGAGQHDYPYLGNIIGVYNDDLIDLYNESFDIMEQLTDNFTAIKRAAKEGYIKSNSPWRNTGYKKYQIIRLSRI